MPRILSFGKSAIISPSAKVREVQAEEQGSISPPPSAVRRPSLTMDLLHLNKEKRKSLALERPPSSKGSPKVAPVKSAKLEIEVQSPPLVFYGTPAGSTGALLGGLLHVAVNEADVKIENFHMRLLRKTHSGKPVTKDCADCTTRTDEVRRWDFVKELKTFSKTTHNFPFSHLLDGSLPASTTSKLGSIAYSLYAEARTATGETLTAVQALEIKRALPEPQMPRTSQRIFPPTNLKTQLEHPTLIYPIGEFNCLFRMTGIVHQDKSARFRWRLRRISWTLNENSKVISAPCAKHANKLGGENKGFEHTDVRAIGQGELKGGWKADYSPGVGAVEMEIRMAANPAKRPVCDVDDKKGLVIGHTLCMELIVAEEVSGLKGGAWSPTGTARVLRTQHHVLVSERTGMGISWDEEMPPMYEDVPESPPWYPTGLAEQSAAGPIVAQSNAEMHDYVGEEIPPEEELDLRR